MHVGEEAAALGGVLRLQGRCGKAIRIPAIDK
jgi:hypothetical protein